MKCTNQIFNQSEALTTQVWVVTRYQSGAGSVVSRGNQWWRLEKSSVFSGYFPSGQLFQNVVNVVHGQVQKCEQKHSLAAVIVKYSQERISQNERKRKPPDGLSQGQKGQNVK